MGLQTSFHSDFMKLFIQIPCLNESESLHRVINDLPAKLPGVECIETLVIDDGSCDGTAATALGLGVHHVLRHKHNRGLAAAFDAGMQACVRLGADIIVNTDGDHQYPGRYVADLVAPIVEGRADIVVGDRNPAEDKRNPWSKRLLYRLGRWTISKLAGRDLPDPVSGFRAYSRSAAIGTHIVTSYSYTIESLMQSVQRGLAIEFVAIETNTVERPSRLFRSQRQFVFRSAMTLLRVFFMYQALAVMLYASAFMAVLGAIPILRFLWLYMQGRGDGHIQSLVLGAALIVFAALLFVAGMIADLVAHNRRLLELTLEEARLRQAEEQGGKLDVSIDVE